MQMVYHMGVHGTSNDRMMKTLLNNRDWMHQNHVEFMTPTRFRNVFDEAIRALQGGMPTPEMEQIMLDAILDNEETERAVCSIPALMGVLSKALGPEGLYPHVGSRMAAIANLFPSAQSEFFVSIKNPISLLQSLMALNPTRPYEQLVQDVDVMSLRWPPVIKNMLQAAQGRRLVVWRHEDTPLIWPEVVRLTANMPTDAPLKGGLSYINDVLTPAGQQNLSQVMSERDQLSVATRRDLCIQHMEEYPNPMLIEETVNLPGWTQEMVDAMTHLYQLDTGEIAGLPGVEFILP